MGWILLAWPTQSAPLSVTTQRSPTSDSTTHSPRSVRSGSILDRGHPGHLTPAETETLEAVRAAATTEQLDQVRAAARDLPLIDAL
jgi:hypothetical protein